MADTSEHPTVVVLGATGLVGQETLDILTEHPLGQGEVRLFASARSAGRKFDDAPPGANPLSTAPSFMPPAVSMSARTVVPVSTHWTRSTAGVPRTRRFRLLGE